jgi:glutathione synthase/RimK-type ligase-like ATP-grasp enzyme
VILVWGSASDSPVGAVISALEAAGEPLLVLDQRQSWDTEIELVVDREVHGVLRHAGQAVDLRSIRGVYLRPYEAPRLDLTTRDEVRARRVALNEALLAWSEVTPARVLNRPSAMASNHSKPYQSALIHARGFEVPHTLLTSDPDALEAFWELHGDVIYKSASGVRSIVSRVTQAHRERFGNLANCPTQFQQCIEGVDIRVHVVGEAVFAAKVESAATDYRYPRTEDEQPRIEAYDLPSEVAERCRSLAAALSLELAGIDLRLTEDGRWFCFEVNPSPGFTYYEHETGQHIAQTVARLLARSNGSGG